MRLKEWFAWHFPEMTKIVNDNHIYAKLVNLLQASRDNINDDLKAEIQAITLDEEKAVQIIEAAKISMGMDMNETDSL
jgi:nucleolar protein 56